MAKERIFELIREEDMVLFVGAGFSMYAGYPSGGKLAEYIYNKLSEGEKKDINFTYDLSSLTEEIYYLKNQNNNFISKCIKDVFSTPPTNNTTHLLLGKIPQFKNIITTNYDSLIEDNNTGLEVIRESKDIPLADVHKPKLYKIHGDLNSLDKLILKKSDYENYFIKNNEQTVFWNEIKSVLAKYHILFIGYSLEDSNIKTIIDKIYNELKDTKKEAFFISPDLKKAKRSYLNSKGIKYIKSTGEEFINELTEDLRLNYLPHIQTKGGSADTTIQFVDKYDLGVKLEKNDNNGLILNEIHPKNKTGLIQTKIDFSTIPDKKLNHNLNSFFEGKLQSLVVENKQFKELSLYQNELRVSDLKNIKSIKFFSLPVFNKKVSLVFDDGYETSEFQLKINGYKEDENKTINKFELFEFTISITTIIDENNNFNFSISIEPKKLISNVKKAIDFYTIIWRVINKVDFQIFSNDSEIEFPLKSSLAEFKNEESLKTTENYFNYFKDLKRIENYFKIRFTNLDLNKIDYKTVDEVISFIDKKEISLKMNTITYTPKTREEIDDLIKFHKKNDFGIGLFDNIKSEVKLHNHKFEIGYKIKLIKDAYIKNIKALENGNSKEVLIASRTNLMYKTFTDNQITNQQNTFN